RGGAHAPVQGDRHSYYKQSVGKRLSVGLRGPKMGACRRSTAATGGGRFVETTAAGAGGAWGRRPRNGLTGLSSRKIIRSQGWRKCPARAAPRIGRPACSTR